MGTQIKKCAIISGAPEENLSYYSKYLRGRYIICADSGYKKCLCFGASPDLIIGDFDSSECPNPDCELVTLNPRKDYTDTFHCVMEAVERGYNDIIILGGIGSRLDHTYSNILSVVYCFERKIACSLINEKNVLSVVSGETVIKKGDFKYFSLFALFEKCEGLSIIGAEYDLDCVDVEPSAQLTQSNEFKNDEVKIVINKGKIILILSND
ncbi:MAG: thiamine diphosphokinase [Eubacterium sp.]|nr:thiamine diphosphokinase [Eubacterium sp.]MDE6155934.1 thiamine diphosphokinase [Eubacterium sp.]